MTLEHDAEPRLSRRAMDQLTHGPTPPPAVEDAIVGNLRARGVLGGRRRLGRRLVPLWASLLAAGLVLVAGLVAGRASVTGAATVTTTIDVAGQAVTVQLAPDSPAIALIRGSLDRAIVRAPFEDAGARPASRSLNWF